MTAGLIGRKVGMTRVFGPDGTSIPVTVIEAGPCTVLRVKTPERDGYSAAVLGFGRRKPKRTPKALATQAAKAGLDHTPRVVREFPVASAGQPARGARGAEGAEGAEGAPEVAPGRVITVSAFAPGERVKVTGWSKGRGFQGVVKRHGFAGGPGSHGQPSIRVPGTVGPGTDPSRVIKGRRMAGHMGNERRTVRRLEVVKVEAERNVLLVKGAVPGPRGGLVLIRKET